MRSQAIVCSLVIAGCVAIACGGSAGTDITSTPGDGGGGSSGSSGSSGDGGSSGGGDGGSSSGGDAGCVDKDGDGVTNCAGDCDDNDKNNFPGNIEFCGDVKDNNCNAQIDEGCGGLGTYVSGDKGDDTNPGTQAKPLKTIQKGIDNAKTIGGKQIVFVAAASYPESINLVEGISLYGGYDCDNATCTWNRDLKLFQSTLLPQRPEGLVADSKITSATKVDGMHVTGKDGGASFAVACPGGSPTLTNNVLTGGAVAGGASRSAGVFVAAPTNDQVVGAIIDSNVIAGGTATGVGSITVGVLIARNGGAGGSPAAAKVSRNDLKGGAVTGGGTSAGVFVSASSDTTLVSGNTITAGAATASRTWGILAASPVKIDSNRINTDRATVGTCNGAGPESCGGGIQAIGSSIVITNNVVFGVLGNNTAAIRLQNPEGAAMGSIVVNANTLDGGGLAGAGNLTRSAALELQISGGVNAVVGRVRNNVLRGGGGALRYGVFEVHTVAKTCHPEAFDHNDFFFAVQAGALDVVYHSDDGAGVSGTDWTLAQLQASALTTPAPAANLQVDCQVAAGTYKLAPASPCINKGVATEAPPLDFEGEARPKGAAVDLGADEAL